MPRTLPPCSRAAALCTRTWPASSGGKEERSTNPTTVVTAPESLARRCRGSMLAAVNAALCRPRFASLRKGEADGGAAPGRSDHRGGASHLLHQLPHDGKAEAAALGANRAIAG